MVGQNKSLFNSFKKTHDLYVENPKKFKSQFNDEGDEVLIIIRRYENLLCRHSENGGFGKFSGGLVEKFWKEIRILLPKIDEVGIK